MWIHPQFSLITAIELCYCFKVIIASWWNPWAVSFLSGNWVRKDACIFAVTGFIDTPSDVFINNFTMPHRDFPCLLFLFSPIYQYVPFFVRHWKIYLAFVAEFVWNSLLEWGTLQLSVCVGYSDQSFKKSCLTLLLHTVSSCNLLCDLLSTFF